MATPQKPIRKQIDFTLVKGSYLIRKLHLERYQGISLCIVRVERNTPAQSICKRNSNGCDAYSKRKAFQCVLASINLIANRAAFAHAIVVGFCRNKKSRVKHDDQNGHGKKQCCNSISLFSFHSAHHPSIFCSFIFCNRHKRHTESFPFCRF